MSMFQWRTLLTTSLVLCCQPTSSAEKDAEFKAKTAIALIDYAGTTAGAFYSLYQADKNLRVAGDPYERMARRVAYEIESGKAASAIARAPFDLAADSLAAAAILDPEPASKVVAAVTSYGSRKLGEAAGRTIYEASEKKALEILARGLSESKYSAKQLEKMTPDQFSTAVENMTIQGQKLKTILQDQPKAMDLIKAHGEDVRNNIGAATLLTAKRIEGTVNDIRDAAIRNEKNLSEFRQETKERFKAIDTGLKDLAAKADEAKKAIADVRAEVGNNTRTLNSLVQISSMSWSTSQKLEALDQGLFPELSEKEKSSLRTVLEKQRDVEKSIGKLQSAAADLGKLSTLAGNLGVKPEVMKAIQGGQILAGGAAQFLAGDYLGAAASVSAIVGLGKPDAAARRHAEMMAYLDKQFTQINQKLDEIKKLQQQTLEAIAALSQQLAAIDTRLRSVERTVSLSRAALQSILQDEFRACDAVANSVNNTTNITRLAEIEAVLAPDVRSQLMSCYQVYITFFDAVVRNPKWSGGRLSHAFFPSLDIIEDTDLQTSVQHIAERDIAAYKAARAFFMSAFPQVKSTPAEQLARLAEPQVTVADSIARDRRLETDRKKFESFKCQNHEVLNPALRTLICQDQTLPQNPPLENRIEIVLNESKLGPQSLRAIDTGLTLAQIADFTYPDPASSVTYAVPIQHLHDAPQKGFTKEMNLAMEARRGAKVLERVQWLAFGYLLQQSVAYGDATTMKIVETLFDPTTKTLRTRYEGATDLQTKALQAMETNPVLARNVVMVAMRWALTTSVKMSDGVVVELPTYSFYADGMRDFSGARACANEEIVKFDLLRALPGWPLELRVSQADKERDPQLKGCKEGDPKAGINTGLIVVFDRFEVKAPSPRAIDSGELELHPALQIARSYVSKVAAAQAQKRLKQALPEGDLMTRGAFARQLLASGCLRGEISCGE